MKEDENALFLCKGTGADRWLEDLRRAWYTALYACNSLSILPEETWFLERRWQLRVGLIPCDVGEKIVSKVADDKVITFKRTLNSILVEKLGNLMRSRGKIREDAERETIRVPRVPSQRNVSGRNYSLELSEAIVPQCPVIRSILPWVPTMGQNSRCITALKSVQWKTSKEKGVIKVVQSSQQQS